MKNSRIAFIGVIALGALVGLGGCLQTRSEEPQNNTTRAQQSQIAQQAANHIVFSRNAEVENISWRLTLTADPALLGYIVLLNQMGQPIMYEAVIGKVTSGSKRLTPSDRVERRDAGGQYTNYAYQVRQAPSDEGTYGTSNPYIFYRNSDGRYRQWSGDYFYSDSPVELTQRPLIVQTNMPTNISQVRREVIDEVHRQEQRANGTLSPTQPAQ